MTRQEIIDALSFCVSDARFPREERCEACTLYPAKGESADCTECINNVLRNAAWMLKVDGAKIHRRDGGGRRRG